MRRRRPAPLGEKGASVVPLSRAHLVRGDSGDTDTSGATAFKVGEGTRSRFGELTSTTSSSPDAGRQQRPNAARAPARARRASTTREVHDGWTFMLIPPGADARPRTLRVSVRRLRFMVVSFSALFGSTALAGGLLVLALSVMPPAQDEVRGVELGVFAARVDAQADGRMDGAMTPAGLAAASAGAAAPRATARTRPASARRPADDPRASGSSAGSSIMESLPVVGEITSRFARARRHPLLGVVRKHAGVDIAAPAGTQITAPASGRVRFSGKRFGYGYTVEIDHGNGIITRYAHCRSLMVRTGDEVADGAVIATVGRSGLATAPHLHYEILVRGRSVDPLRTTLVSLLTGTRPAPAPGPPQPTDSALRDPATPDAVLAPDVPDGSFPVNDEIIISPPVIARTSSVVAVPPPSVVASPPAVARDTARKS